MKARILTAMFLVVGTVGSCANTTTTSPGSPNTTTKVFDLHEWTVSAPDGLKAGKVKLTASNSGGETHELVLVRGTDPNALPTNADGSINEDDIAESDKIGEIADVAAGRSTTKTFDLPAGSYLAFCNIVEKMGMGMDMGDGNQGMTHVHYQLGMVTAFTVS